MSLLRFSAAGQRELRFLNVLVENGGFECARLRMVESRKMACREAGKFRWKFCCELDARDEWMAEIDRMIYEQPDC